MSAISAVVLAVHGCSNGDHEGAKQATSQSQSARMPNVVNQPYVLVPVPQDSWVMGGRQDQGPRQAPIWRDSHPEVAPPPVERRLESVNPWQPGGQQPQGAVGQGQNPWLSGGQQAPVMPQFRPLEEEKRKPYESSVRPMPAAPYDRIQGSSQHPGVPGYPGYQGYPGYGYPQAYGYPGYAPTPYAYPGAPVR